MVNLAKTLPMHWDAGMIVISYLVSVQAAYTALQILQMRTSVWLIAIAALSLSVSGIWSMHFIGMAAMTVTSDVTYNVGWTIGSVFFAYVPTFIAFWILDWTMVHRQRKLIMAVAEEEIRSIELDQQQLMRPAGPDEGGLGEGRDSIFNASTPAFARPALLGGTTSEQGGTPAASPTRNGNGAQQLSGGDADAPLARGNTISMNPAGGGPFLNRFGTQSSFALSSFITRTDTLRVNPTAGGRGMGVGAPQDVSASDREMETRSNATSATLRGRPGGRNEDGNMTTTGTILSQEESEKITRQAVAAATAEQFEAEDTRDISFDAHVRALKRAPHAMILLGGALIALGACLMHYLGMHAMSLNGNVRREFNYGVVVASCFIAMFAGTAALYFAFVIPSTREYTVPTAIIAGAAVSGMHYVGMYGIRYVDPNGVQIEMSDMDHFKHKGDTSIEPYVIYIIFASSAVSFVSLSMSTYFYRESLRKAADDAEERAGLIIAGKFDQLGDLSNSVDTLRQDPIMARLQVSNAKLGDQMQKLRSFLPPSLLAQFEIQEGIHDHDEAIEDDDEDDDEGDLSLRMSVLAAQSARPGFGDQSTISGSATFRGGALSGNASHGLSPVNGSVRMEGGVHALLAREEMIGSRRSRLSGASESTVASAMTTATAAANNKRKVNGPAAHYGMAVDQRNVGILALNCHNFNVVLGESSSQLMSVYSHFMEGLCSVAKSQRGVLDIVHGDRVLMTFNASMRNASYGRCAATAAVHIARDVGAPGPRGCMAIGIATGQARMGNLGCRMMMKYNVCGPVVSTAVRAQEFAFSLHEEHGVHICGVVTEEMKMAVRTRALDIVQWKQMHAPVIISEIVGNITTGAADEWMYELENNSGDDPFLRINKAFNAELALQKKGDTTRNGAFEGGCPKHSEESVLAPPLCFNCSSQAKRTQSEILQVAEMTLAELARKRMEIVDDILTQSKR